MATNPLRPVLLAAGRSRRLERVVARSVLTRSLVERFIAGSTEPEVVGAVADLLGSGRFVSVDHLGEDTTDAAQATATVDAYLSLLRAYSRLHTPQPAASPSNSGRPPAFPPTSGRPPAFPPTSGRPPAFPLEISLKLSALGQSLPDDGHAVALANAHKVCAAADAAGVWVTVDAEDHTTTDSTLAIVRELRKDFPTLGTVLQAYLHRTEQDCRELSGPGSRIRLCKGAYREPASVAFQKRAEVDASYERCLRVLMEGEGYPMVASHDPRMIEAARRDAAELGRGPGDMEYQMLYGIRDNEQTRLVSEGYRVRVYVPFGTQWYGYFMRRLAERPANLTFFLRSLLTRS
ncbi:proline dehydrogenase family protein [Rhodococcus sp. BP-349]|uniref:proline dehydrogenase family protein n=1 Tax=unclassified Rhodococcus (in: high G+C Gram-positive bacteria) TaxID=192944 RepID=UPI001C9B6425|nr:MULTISPECIES: proline dehydrogenase family protein [unclassified Rhodococcus (in: high G+C Gram-positive bacteria)]MBY6538081.1 proline dehydrogenase family protein [Rhodococcus sp. BP-363]MBY6542418.1 proline dehydrogenase family protein [Rhodococcus sp. BP-369]MBY6561648.1 proline dehydrogenase family protein [Rhodococcus sp. BP-370]MBY6575940.1 proline dehydrogenase family protein [Rhodococcus sp. BP-364]MBY6585241.1 proline dehydrogenase family protein [Rhodococcus sp. BP-358]